MVPKTTRGFNRLMLTASIVQLISVCLASGSFAEDRPDRFINMGLGGGGAMFSPSCSPHNHDEMFVACDMGGVYRSVDGGKSWTMFDKRQLRNGVSCPVQFHPTDPNTYYAAHRGQFVVSRDGARTFAPLDPAPPWKFDTVTAVSVHPTSTSIIYVGAGTQIYQSDDGGTSWTKAEGGGGKVLRFFAAARTSSATSPVFAGTTEGVFRSDDNGKTWTDSSNGLPWRELRGFCGGRDEKNDRVALYCTIATKVVDGKLAGGVFRSVDGGATWQSAMKQGLNLDIGKQDQYGSNEIPQYYAIAMAETRPNIVYVTTPGTGSRPPHHFTVYRTDDFGDSWRYCFTSGGNVEPGWVATDLSYGFGGPALGFNVCSSNPDIAMFTNYAELYITRDGGTSWQNVYSRRVDSKDRVKRGEAWASCGLEVTTCWQVAFDPNDSQRAYICYTDIGFARSTDRGKTWRHNTKGSPWRNTWYQVAFDPARPGVIYGACSNHHDIPNYKELDPRRQQEPRRRGGGVCVSEDYGASWLPLSGGLPLGSATSIAIDLKSPRDRRTLYVAMFGHGVFKSTDSGTTWHKVSDGLGTPDNQHVYSVKLHGDGTLFCTITGKREGSVFADGGGLYRSRDGGSHWERISPALRWVNDFDFDPKDSNTIYFAAATAPRFPEGGLYKTTDGGTTWKQVIKEGDLPPELHRYIHAFFVALHPKNPNMVYLSTLTHGLFLSEDAGTTWREVRGIPFTGINRITFDPHDDDTIWVTTEGGGVWKGPARGI